MASSCYCNSTGIFIAGMFVMMILFGIITFFEDEIKKIAGEIRRVLFS